MSDSILEKLHSETYLSNSEPTETIQVFPCWQKLLLFLVSGRAINAFHVSLIFFQANCLFIGLKFTLY